MNLSSSSQVRVLRIHNVDEMFEDIPAVLPPLQSFSSGATNFSIVRPPPLEPRPNNRVNIQTQSTTLSSRQKALADAKPLENGDLEIDAPQVPFSGNLEESGQRTQIPTPPDPEQARKKARLRHNEQIADFVHLPNPQFPRSSSKGTRLPPLRPIAELNEPPSGAARFPPITPRGNSHGNVHRNEQDEPQPLPKLLPKETFKTNRGAPTRRVAPQVKKRRTYTRERTKWTEGETEQLVQGLAIYGTGRWKTILDHPDFHFHPSRTHVDLKDRFRVLFPPNEPHKWVRPMPEHISDEDNNAAKSKKQGEKPKLRKRKQAWTEREDQELDKGFRKHGYQWERIAKDESLSFDNRSGSNIRDRFRLKYPAKWAEPRPTQLDPGLVRQRPRETEGAVSGCERLQKESNLRNGRVNSDESISPSFSKDHKSSLKDTAQMQMQGQVSSDWLSDLWNDDWEAPAGGLALPPPPVRWEDMAVQTPMLDFG